MIVPAKIMSQIRNEMEYNSMELVFGNGIVVQVFDLPMKHHIMVMLDGRFQDYYSLKHSFFSEKT